MAYTSPSTTCLLIFLFQQGTFLVTQAVTKALLKKKQETGKEKGAVVNIASTAGKTGSYRACHYAASKGGVISLTKSCAAELVR